MSTKIAKHIFNTVVFNDLLPNEAIMQSIGLHWTGVANRGITYYNIEKKDMPDDDIEKSTLSIDKASGIFIVENEYPDFNVGDVYSPFDLLVKLRFKGDEKSAENYLIVQGYDDVLKYVAELIFDGKRKFDAYKASEFLKVDGYLRVSEQGRDETVVYKIDNGIMREFNVKSDTISLFKTKLKGHPKESILVNELHKSRASVNTVWNLLEGVPYDLQMDTKNSTYIPFKNGVAKITKGNYQIEIIKYDELKLFLPTESMKHEIKPFDVENREIGNFEKFIRCAIAGHDKNAITPKQANDVTAFYSAIGCLLSSHKDLAQNKAIIWSDAGADDVNRNGRRGKTLIMLALRRFKPSIMKGGSEFDPNYRHVFADIENYHKIYLLDDVARNFNYHALYTNITGGISAERKGTKAIEIPYSQSPKFMISTNWIVPKNNDEASTIARFAEYQFSNFFNASHTPLEYFGETFFQDWNEKEYQLFHEFILTCIMVFLNDGLIEIEYRKESDNYFAYFSNSVVEDEMERIMREMEGRTEFKVSDFLKEHDKEESYRYKKLFNHISAKRRIDIWIEYHKLNWMYNTQWRKWEKVFENENDEKNPF